MELVTPSKEHLGSFEAALERGWSADNVRGKVAAGEELERLRSDSKVFLASMVDREAKAGPVTLPDGSTVPRIPGLGLVSRPSGASGAQSQSRSQRRRLHCGLRVSPNPSIERTAQRPLRALCAAAHVER
jgi:hypothetical protein